MSKPNLTCSLTSLFSVVVVVVSVGTGEASTAGGRDLIFRIQSGTDGDSLASDLL